jgi:hypothetical protein
MTKKEGTKRNSADSASAEPCDVMLNRSNRQGFGSVFVRDKKCYLQIRRRQRVAETSFSKIFGDKNSTKTSKYYF